MHRKAKILRYFDDYAVDGKYAKLYDQDGDNVANYKFIIRQRRAYELLAPMLGTDIRVLDLGCGPGVMTPLILQHEACYFGMDLSEKIIGKTNRQYVQEAANGASVKFAVGDVESLAFPDAHFDIVMGLGVLEYLAAPQRAADEIVRITRPGGNILLSVPIAMCPNQIAYKVFSPFLRWPIRAIRKLRGREKPITGHPHHQLSSGRLDSLFTSRGCQRTGHAYYNHELAIYPLWRLFPSLSLHVKRWAESHHHSLFRIFATGYIGYYVKQGA